MTYKPYEASTIYHILSCPVMSYHTYIAAHCPVLSCPTLCAALLLLLFFCTLSLLLLFFFTLLLLLLLSTISLLFLLVFILFSLSQPLLSLQMHILNLLHILPQRTLLVIPAYHTTHPHCPSASSSPPPHLPQQHLLLTLFLSPSHFSPPYPPLFSPMYSPSPSPSFRQLYSLQKLSPNSSLRCLTTVSISSHIKS